jgi:hypothetical protein
MKCDRCKRDEAVYVGKKALCSKCLRMLEAYKKAKMASNYYWRKLNET